MVAHAVLQITDTYHCLVMPEKCHRKILILSRVTKVRSYHSHKVQLLQKKPCVFFGFLGSPGIIGHSMALIWIEFLGADAHRTTGIFHILRQLLQNANESDGEVDF